jgi:hypothetical protein
VRIGDETPKGYYRHQFEDAWSRLLPPEGGFKPQHRNNADETGTSDLFQSATERGVLRFEKPQKSNNHGLCGGVAVQKGVSGQQGTNGAHGSDLSGGTSEGIGRRPRLIGGYDVVGVEPPGTPCLQCGDTVGTVYLVRVPGPGAQSEPLHEGCAGARFGTPSSAAEPKQGIPFMITAAMKAELRKRGLSDIEISNLTPQRAHEIINDAEPLHEGTSSERQDAS